MRGSRSLRGLGAEAETGVTRYGDQSAWAKRDQKAVSFPTLVGVLRMNPWACPPLGKVGNFPTRILTLEIYWGISPVKSHFIPNVDHSQDRFWIFCTQNVATSEKYWTKSTDILVLDSGYLGSQLSGDPWYVPGFPSGSEAADTPLDEPAKD